MMTSLTARITSFYPLAIGHDTVIIEDGPDYGDISGVHVCAFLPKIRHITLEKKSAVIMHVASLKTY